jgi:hypothetical protein
MINIYALPFVRTCSLAILFLFLPMWSALAQLTDTTYFSKDGVKVKGKANPEADYFVITSYADTTKSVLTQKGFYLSGEKKSEKHFTGRRSAGTKMAK